MLNKIKKFSFEKRIKKYLLQRNNSDNNSKLVNIGFLVDEDAFPNLENLYSLSEAFGIQRNDIKIFSFKKLDTSAPALNQNAVSQKDFTFNGSIKNDIANDFLDIEFDVLVGYYKEEHLYLDLMVAQSNAIFKVGLEGTDARLFDLTLAIKPRDEDVFAIEMVKYLNALQKI